MAFSVSWSDVARHMGHAIGRAAVRFEAQSFDWFGIVTLRAFLVPRWPTVELKLGRAGAPAHMSVVAFIGAVGAAPQQLASSCDVPLTEVDGGIVRSNCFHVLASAGLVLWRPLQQE